MPKPKNPNTVLAEVRANTAKRDSCALHRFDPKEYTFGGQMTCANCGCKVRVHYISPYIAGYVAAGGNADAIWEGWQAACGGIA